MTTRGRIKLIALCFVAGAMINLAVAWGCAIWSKPRWEKFSRLSDEESQILWDRHAHSDWAQPLSHFFHAFSGESHGVVHDMIYASDGLHGIIRVRTGWPLKTVEAFGSREGDANIVSVHAWELSAGIDRLAINAGTWLPYGPIWPGVMLNTLFYAAIVWLLVRSPIEARRRWRQWRGLCASCAYPIGESPVCTECGATINRAKLNTGNLNTA